MKLSKQEEAQIQAKLQDISSSSSAKVAVHVDEYCKGDPYYKAVNIFNEMGFLRHEEQNSVVIYVATKDKKLAIATDSAITDDPEGLRNSIVEAMTIELKIGRLYPAIETALDLLQKYLVDHFPVNTTD